MAWEGTGPIHTGPAGYTLQCAVTSVQCTVDHSGNDHFLEFGYARQCKLSPRHIETDL